VGAGPRDPVHRECMAILEDLVEAEVPVSACVAHTHTQRKPNTKSNKYSSRTLLLAA
jgi:hypothetical protein